MLSETINTRHIQSANQLPIAGQPEWYAEAACSGMTSGKNDPWYSQDEKQVEYAKSICRQCPVASECLAQTFQNNEHFGIWGGLDYAERYALQHPNRMPQSKAIR